MFQLYKKNHELANAPLQVRLTHDFEKWHKKFFMVFTREKALDMSLNPALPLDKRNIATRKPLALNKAGERILRHNHKFWVVYLRIVGGRLSDRERQDYAEGVRGVVQGDEGAWQEVRRYLEGVIDFDKEN